jgi:ATP-dependent Clp protease ATP-binding subunit ClpC
MSIMFDRFTEKARRVIFWARYEASQFGTSSIQTEHLLLGLLKEDLTLNQRFLGAASSESIRQLVEARAHRGAAIIPTSVDLPLSHECKRVLAYAAEEAARLKHVHTGPKHVLFGLLREEKSLAAIILREQGLELAGVREELSRGLGELD